MSHYGIDYTVSRVLESVSSLRGRVVTHEVKWVLYLELSSAHGNARNKHVVVVVVLS